MPGLWRSTAGQQDGGLQLRHVWHCRGLATPTRCENLLSEELEAKDGQFVRYMKSGQAPQNPFEKMRDMAEDIKEKAVERNGPAKPSAKSKKSSSEVVDVEAGDQLLDCIKVAEFTCIHSAQTYISQVMSQ